MKKLIFLCLFIVGTVNAFAGTPSVDGVLDASAGYILLSSSADTPASRTGFGTSIDASQLWYTYDSSSVYIFLQGYLNPSTSDGILLLIGASNTTGTSANTYLGGVPGFSSGPFGSSTSNWAMDFKVDHAFWANVGPGPYPSSHIYIDEANYLNGGKTGQFFTDLGTAGISQSSTEGFTMAFNTTKNSGGAGTSTGWEIALDRNSFLKGSNGAIQSTDSIQIYAIIASSAAYFSDDASPVTFIGNAGANPDFANCHVGPFSVGTSTGSPVIDGTLDASAGYIPLTDTTITPGSRVAFTGADASQIWYTSDANTIYFFIQGTMDSNNDGILFLVNASSTTSVAAGTQLGGISGGGTVFGAPSSDWYMDFPVSRAWYCNAGTTATNCYVDEANYLPNTPLGFFWGNCSTAGVSFTGADGSAQAFKNSGSSGGLGNSTGWEIGLPRSLFNNIQNTDTLEVYAIVVSTSAYFSDDAAPLTFYGSPGFDPINHFRFQQDQHLTAPLPVELSKFLTEE